jgi:hypothetical protein
VVWEGLAAAGITWLRERWSPRIIATASAGMATALAVMDIVSSNDEWHWGAPAWLAWIVVAGIAYRHWLKDLFVLATAILSLTIVAAVFLADVMRLKDAGTFLFIGLMVIGISAAGGWWLKNLANEEERP